MVSRAANAIFPNPLLQSYFSNKNRRVSEHDKVSFRSEASPGDVAGSGCVWFRCSQPDTDPGTGHTHPPQLITVRALGRTRARFHLCRGMSRSQQQNFSFGSELGPGLQIQPKSMFDTISSALQGPHICFRCFEFHVSAVFTDSNFLVQTRNFVVFQNCAKRSRYANEQTMPVGGQGTARVCSICVRDTDFQT